jgi:glutamyl-tRNA synthetase
MQWGEATTGGMMEGFKELGFMPEAFINMLAMLGWNDGTEKEIFTMDELTDRFSVERVHSSGAKFDFEKAKWFNHEWIKKSEAAKLLPHVEKIFNSRGYVHEDTKKLLRVIELVKDRCTLLTDFWQQAQFFFIQPKEIDASAILSKWDDNKNLFFNELIKTYQLTSIWDRSGAEHSFKEIAAAQRIKPGELMLPFRIMLVGATHGPGVFDIAALIGKEETIKRIEHGLFLLH